VAHIVKDWLKKNKIKARDFAKKCGVHKHYFSKVINGKMPMSISMAKKIEENTNYEISALSLLFPGRVRTKTFFVVE